MKDLPVDLSEIARKREDEVFDSYVAATKIPFIGELMKRMLVESIVHAERQLIAMSDGNKKAGREIWNLVTERERYQKKRQQAEKICGRSFSTWYQEQRQGLAPIGPDGSPT